MSARGPKNVRRAVQKGSNIVVLRFGDHETTEMLGVIGSKLCATTPNNTQQHATGCANGRNM